MIIKRRLQERLIQEVKRRYDEARLLTPGPVRDAALKRARWAEAAAHMDEWLNSPGLRPPIELSDLLAHKKTDA